MEKSVSESKAKRVKKQEMPANFRPTTIKRTKGDVVFDCVNVFINFLLLAICIYPLYFVLLASISDPFAVARGEVVLWPVGFTTEPFQTVFNEASIWIGYRNTIFYTVTGTLFSLFLTIPSAYALSKRSMPGRKFFNIYFLIPMYFGGGLIPTYLQMKNMGLVNQWYSMIFLAAASIYNMIVSRVFFETSIPEELYESARIDGASELRAFFSIALPLSGSIMAVMALFFAVAKWNNYFTALVYVTKGDYQPLQMVLRSILLNAQTALAGLDPSTMDAETLAVFQRRQYLAEAMKYALIVVSSAPLLIAYPFVQKYFVKGMMIGAVKG